MARRDRGTSNIRLDEDDDRGGLALDMAGAVPPTGPHDGDVLDPEVTDAAGLVDFGAIRVPVPPDGTVTVEPTANGRMQAVHIALPEGRLSVSALAAPKTSKLWPELSREIDASLREGGARVRSFSGEWGRELHATSGGATSLFLGVDGSRWMIYGVATGPTAQAATLDAELRRLLRGTVVMRGKKPYPVRTILPLVMPDHLAESADAAGATPVVATPGAKKRSPGKSGAGKSAPGKAAPGKSSPPKGDATSTAAEKAAARRAAARKAAAAAAVKAAAEALAEQAAEDRAAAGERGTNTGSTDTGSAARVARTGAYPAPGTIPTGPGPDAPVREQAPSARRAAAAAWRSRPAAPGFEEPPPTEALPVTRRAGDVPPVTEALPAARADLPPTEALRPVDPGAGDRRRLREQAPPADFPPAGRRHLREPVADEPRPAGWRRPPEPADDRYGPEPPEPAVGGRRALREPGIPVPPEGPGGGRRRLREPDGGAIGATAPWDLGVPEDGSGGRRQLARPESRPDAPGGRRRLREPFDEGGRAGVGPRDAGAGPGGPVADTGVSASGRRRLREPFDERGRAAMDPRDAGAGPVADAGVSASGRRSLREPWDEAERAVGEPNDSGVSGTGGRRRFAEPIGESGWAGVEPREPRGRAAEPVADAGVSATGRRRLQESWDEAGRGAGPEWNGSGVSGSGRRRSAEPLGESGWGRVEPGEPGAGSGGPVADAGVSASGRRRLREPWDEAERAVGPEPNDSAVSGTGGRRRFAEPIGESGWAGAGGRRRLEESFDEFGRRIDPEPPGTDTGPDAGWADGPVARTGDGYGAGPGGRRRREPFGETRSGAGAQPWETGAGPSAPVADTGVSASGRRHLREPSREPGRGPEPWDTSGDMGTAGGRRLREPFGERGPAPEPYGRPVGERGADDPGGRRRRDAGERGDELISGTGGRRRLREPGPTRPVRDGSPTEPWLYGPSGPGGDADEPFGSRGRGADLAAGGPRDGRRYPGTEYVGDTGEQDAGWAQAHDGYAEPRGGRHSGNEPGEASPPTTRLRALLGDLDPNRPSGRHRR